MLIPSLILTLFLAPGLPAQAPRTLVCLGDSLTAGYGLDEDKAYPALLQARLDRDLPGWTVHNAGVSGDTTAGGLKRLDWILRGKPDVVLVCMGANDGLRGVPAKETEANLNAMLAKIKAAGALPLLAGMDLPTNLGEAYRRDFRAIFPRVAKAQKAALLDFLLKGVGGEVALNLADGIHPNEAGQAKVADNVAQFVLPRLKALPARPAAAEGASVPKVLRKRSDLKGKP